ncbi:MAG: glycosyltransferase family 2 protein [Candidatus Levybacteria bacterium]|nr:glycosyltransferase family 2 protein [Candidatus Levybacteria bacterium]
MEQPLVSIIIVYYKVRQELVDCLFSIEKSKTKISHEIIVVDNDEEPTIKKDLKQKFPQVQYIDVGKNIGFGAANNKGAKAAKGKFLFFLNPDTLVERDTIDELINFIKKEKNIGIVSPLFLDSKNRPYPLQGSATLTPFRAISCLSFINKLFPNNMVARKYWYLDWDKKQPKEVDVMPGTAFLIRKKLFEEIGGFDERFFLFFEENDIAMKVKKKGFRIVLLPHAKVVHLWGMSAKNKSGIKQIFRRSRFLYFQKYYGSFWAYIVEVFCR